MQIFGLILKYINKSLENHKTTWWIL